MEVDGMRAATVGFFSDLNPHAARRTMWEEGISHHDVSDHHTYTPAAPAAATVPAAFSSGKGDGSKQLQDSVQWLDLGLCKALVRAVTQLGFFAPTPVQVAAIPEALAGSDVCVRAVTGSGKTASFLLPLLHQLLTRPAKRQTMTGSKRKAIRAVVLVPSRELGVQCETMAKQLLQFTTGLTTALAIGGVAAKAQEAALDAAPDLLIATPGRLCDLIANYKTPRGQPKIDLGGVEFFVLDECDKMLTILMIDQVTSILKETEQTLRQTILVSATMTQDVDEFAKEHLFKPKNVDLGHVALAAQLRQQFVRIKTSTEDIDGNDRVAANPALVGTGRPDGRADRKRQRAAEEGTDAKTSGADDSAPPTVVDAHISKVKTRYLVALCTHNFKSGCLIFTKYRTTAHRLAIIFNELGMNAGELQGNQVQDERIGALERFARGELNFLICTDVASRGLDIRGVDTVINFDLPPTLTTYIHRVGRTARIGERGTAVSLVHEVDDAEIMRKIITISARINAHQIASVKRRDVPVEQLRAATTAIDAIFSNVKASLAAESLEADIDKAEKKALNAMERASAFTDRVVAKPQRQWCLTREERRSRELTARKEYEREKDVTLQEVQTELNALDQEQSRYFNRQKAQRAQVRTKQENERVRRLDDRKALKRKEDAKLQGGIVKRMKKHKIREARKEKRAASREKKGAKPYKRSSTFKKGRRKGNK